MPDELRRGAPPRADRFPILATYRLQLHAGFPLDAAAALVPYLASLGVSHLHLSPVLRARRGSPHGYDVVDPSEVNPELGGEAALARLVSRLHEHGTGLVLDIVPNHMAASTENPRWEDVLTHGPASPYARWFDVDWRADARYQHRVLLPVLGDFRVHVVARDEIRVVWDGARLRLAYWEHRFPLDPRTVAPLLTWAAELCRETDADESGVELRACAVLARSIPLRTERDPARLARRLADGRALWARLAALVDGAPRARDALERAAQAFGAGPAGRTRIRRLLDAQPYALVYWRRAAREINYRRFFDVNDLVALHMEDPEVFRESHALLLAWAARGWVDGFRVDHPDGLRDPLGYLRRLADAAFHWRADRRYPVFVEKILSAGETLPDTWPVAGTTGYDFLNEAEALFIDPAGLRRIEADYRRIARHRADFEMVARTGKRRALQGGLAAGVRAFARRLLHHAAGDRPTLRETIVALIEAVAALPVYRTYADAQYPSGSDADRVHWRVALDAARAGGRATPRALALIEWLTGLANGGGDAERTSVRLALLQRLQQLTGPATAKGVEDTAFYLHVPLLSRNEVGAAPERPVDDAVPAFHAANVRRAEHWPGALLAVTTHDTKRTADVRARLDVLSELPDEWEERVYHWRRWNRPLVRTVRDRRAPDLNTEYYLYQSLLGVWPAEYAVPGAASVPDEACLAQLRGRLHEHAVKAVREAKERTSWVDPDAAYEEAVVDFVEGLVSRDRSSRFLDDMARLAARVVRPGIWNAIARSILHLTAPGATDLYQGDELWNLALVDPDNRRPVDFARRIELLERGCREFGASATRSDALRQWLARPEDGRLKLHVCRQGLAARRADPALFHAGTYEPLQAKGARASQVVAFVRRAGARVVVVAAPRLVLSLLDPATLLPDPACWDDTYLPLPPDLHVVPWTAPLAGVEHAPAEALRLGDLFRALPAALLVGTVG